MRRIVMISRIKTVPHLRQAAYRHYRQGDVEIGESGPSLSIATARAIVMLAGFALRRCGEITSRALFGD